MKKNKEDLNKSEVSKTINNALMLASNYLEQNLNSKSKRKIKRTLREYTEGLLEAPLSHLNERLILPEELVLILITSAATIQQLHVDKASKINIRSVFEE